ncbi:hypothetical protein [Jannaschia sp. R86511]|uniref:hypothetical protein n=1 Tax=Jannaschia sp. R86511 TaxID=3093853 RepID=UPI0036D2AAA6
MPTTTAAAPATGPTDADAAPEDQEPRMPEDTPGTTPGTAPGTAPTGAVLTEQDSGAQVALTVGEERTLRLGSAWSWSEPVVAGDAVVLTPVDYLVDPGYVEWLVSGAATGSATLEATGEPVCGDTTVCPPTTVTLEVEVTG